MSKSEEDYLDQLLNSLTDDGDDFDNDDSFQNSLNKVKSFELSDELEKADDLFHMEEDDFLKDLENELKGADAARYLKDFEAELESQDLQGMIREAEEEEAKRLAEEEATFKAKEAEFAAKKAEKEAKRQAKKEAKVARKKKPRKNKNKQNVQADLEAVDGLSLDNLSGNIELEGQEETPKSALESLEAMKAAADAQKASNLDAPEESEDLGAGLLEELASQEDISSTEEAMSPEDLISGAMNAMDVSELKDSSGMPLTNPTMAGPASEEETSGAEESALDRGLEPGDVDLGLMDESNLGAATEELPMTEAGEVDLAGNSDDDLMSLLSGEGDLSDLGDLLSADENDTNLASEDAIGDFAEKEMQSAEDAISEEEEEEPKKGKKKKKKKDDAEDGEKKEGFFAKLLHSLFKEPEEDAEDMPLELKAEEGVDLQELSDENMQILRELEAAEGGGEGEAAPAEEEDAKKKKKEKKEKPKKEKKEKPKKEKKEKPKKEKKPFFNDNSPKLPVVPVILILVLVGSMAAMVYLAVDLGTYQTELKNANTYYAAGASDYKNYIKAYDTLAGVELKEDDADAFARMELVAQVADAYQDYEAFISRDDQEAALDNLICVIGRYDVNYEQAESLECLSEMTAIKDMAAQILQDTYHMSVEEAYEMYDSKTRKEYSKKLYLKLVELGLE